MKFGVGKRLFEDCPMPSAAVPDCPANSADPAGHFDGKRRVDWQDLVCLQQESILREVEHRYKMLEPVVA